LQQYFCFCLLKDCGCQVFAEAHVAISRPVHQLPVAFDFHLLTEANNAINRAIRQPNRSSRNTRKQQLHEEKSLLEQPISALCKTELESFLQTKTGRRLYGITSQVQANQLASNCAHFLNLVAPELKSKIQARLFESVNVNEFSIRPVVAIDDERILEPKEPVHRKSIPEWETHDIQMFARGNMVRKKTETY
jgi:hypothetical protein